MAAPTIRHAAGNANLAVITPNPAPAAGNYVLINTRHQHSAANTPTTNLGADLPLLGEWGPASSTGGYYNRFYGKVVASGETSYTLANFGSGTRGWSYYELASTNGGDWKVVDVDGRVISTGTTVHSPPAVDVAGESVAVATTLWSSSQASPGDASWSTGWTRSYYDRYTGSTAHRFFPASGTTQPTVTLAETKTSATGVIVLANIVPPLAPAEATTIPVGFKRGGRIVWTEERYKRGGVLI